MSDKSPLHQKHFRSLFPRKILWSNSSFMQEFSRHPDSIHVKLVTDIEINFLWNCIFHDFIFQKKRNGDFLRLWCMNYTESINLLHVTISFSWNSYFHLMEIFMQRSNKFSTENKNYFLVGDSFVFILFHFQVNTDGINFHSCEYDGKLIS